MEVPFNPEIETFGVFRLLNVAPVTLVGVQIGSSLAYTGFTPVSTTLFRASQYMVAPPIFPLTLVMDCVGAGTFMITSANPLTQGPLTVHLSTYVPCIKFEMVALLSLILDIPGEFGPDMTAQLTKTT